MVRAAEPRAGGRRGCRVCRHFVDDCSSLEEMFPAVVILSSVHGCARGESGVCGVRGTYQDPEPACDAFEWRSAEVAFSVTDA